MFELKVAMIVKCRLEDEVSTELILVAGGVMSGRCDDWTMLIRTDKIRSAGALAIRLDLHASRLDSISVAGEEVEARSEVGSAQLSRKTNKISSF
jgi:hypothetical protein